MEVAMPIPLRDDFDAAELRREAKKSKDGGQARRLLALAAIYGGSTRTEAAKIGGVTVQIIRDWVVKFNARGPAGLIAGKAPGQTPRLTAEHREALARMVEGGPIPAVDGVVRWRLVDLCQWVFEEYSAVVSIQTMGRQLRAMGYRKLSARPKHHAQAESTGLAPSLDFLASRRSSIASKSSRSGIGIANSMVRHTESDHSRFGNPLSRHR